MTSGIATQTVAVKVPTVTIEMDPVAVSSPTPTIAPPSDISPVPLQVIIPAAIPSSEPPPAAPAAVVEPLKPVLDTSFSDESFLPIHSNPTSQPQVLAPANRNSEINQTPAPSVPQQQAPVPPHYGYIQMAPDGQLYIYNPQQQQPQQQQQQQFSFYPLSASMPAFPFTHAATHPAHAADTPLPLPSYYPNTAMSPLLSTPAEPPSYTMTARELVQAYSTSKNQLHSSTPTSSSHTHHIPITSSGSHTSAGNHKRSSDRAAYTPMSASLSSLSIIDRKKTDIEEIRRKLTLLKQSTSTTHTTTSNNNNNNDLKKSNMTNMRSNLLNGNKLTHGNISTNTLHNRIPPVHSSSTATASSSSGTGGLLVYPETMSYYSHLRRPIYD